MFTLQIVGWEHDRVSCGGPVRELMSDTSRIPVGVGACATSMRQIALGVLLRIAAMRLMRLSFLILRKSCPQSGVFG